MKKNFVIDSDASELPEPRPGSISVETLLRQRNENSWDVTSKIQRESVWETRRRCDLLDSLILGVSVNTFHLVQKNSDSRCNEYWVIDGRQRVETIRRFYGGEFSVNFMTDKGEKKLTYKAIEKLAEGGDIKSKKFIQKLLNANLLLNYYPPLTDNQMTVLFSKINGGKAVSQIHLRYVTNPHLKDFLEELWDKSFSVKNKEMFKNNLRDPKGSENLVLMHKWLLLALGRHLDADFTLCDCGGSALDESARKMDEGISKLTEAERENKMLESKIQDACGLLMSVAEHQPSLKKVPGVWVLDCVMFFISGLQDKTLTPSFIKDPSNTKVFWDILHKHQKWQDDPNGGKQYSYQTTHVKHNIQSRLCNLKMLFEQSGLDIGKKNRGISEADRRNAHFEAPIVDPLSQKPLNRNNVAIDHCAPKSKSSETDYRAISTDTNGLKNNLTKENLESYIPLSR